MNLKEMTVEMLEALPLEGIEPETRALIEKLRARKEPTVEARVQQELSALVTSVLRNLRAAKARATDLRERSTTGTTGPRAPMSARLVRGDL